MFWENLIYLCNEKNISPNKVCAELGYSNAVATKWKNGAVPRSTTLKKIADYFGVSVDALLGKEDKKTESPPARELSELEKEFIDLIRDISEEQAQQLLTLLRSFQREK